jgi:hypothetical protein
MSNTTIYKEFINDKARRQLFRPYQPSSCHKYKNAEGLSANYRRYQAGSRGLHQAKVNIEHNRLFRNNTLRN